MSQTLTNTAKTAKGGQEFDTKCTDEDVPSKTARRKFNIDEDKPLFPQVAGLGDTYWAWIHNPHRTGHENNMIVTNPIADWLGKNTIPMMLAGWLPPVTAFSLLAMNSTNAALPALLRGSAPLAPSSFVMYLIFGFVFWQIAEYWLHRKVFHFKPTKPWQNTVHFMAHGYHHVYPQDPNRVLFPVPLAYVLSSMFFFAFMVIFRYEVALSVWCGMVAGYLVYDSTHWMLHHAKIKPDSYWFKMKKYHMAHHWSDSNHGFGISSCFFDILFGTLPPKKELTKKDT